jgi:hypothetical protein
MNTPSNTIEEPVPDGWSDIMLMILRENWSAMDDEQLATVIGVKPMAIRRKMYELSIKRPKVKRVYPVTEKQVQKQVELKKREQDKKRINMDYAAALARKARKEDKKFETRERNLAQMQTVRIDSKTWIYVKPGDDIEKLKKKYLRTFSKDGLSKIEW